MNLLICKRCKEPSPETEISKAGWCLRCKHKYATRLAMLGKAKKLPIEVTPTKPTTGIDELVRLARLGGQLKAQALQSNNKWKWKQYFENEFALKKELTKWKSH